MTDESRLNVEECWAVLSYGGIAVRYGPFTAIEGGKILQEGLRRELPLTLVLNCGREIPWDLLVEPDDSTQPDLFPQEKPDGN